MEEPRSPTSSSKAETQNSQVEINKFSNSSSNSTASHQFKSIGSTRVLLTIMPEDMGVHVLPGYVFHRRVLELLKKCECSVVVSLVAYHLAEILVSEGHPYSREMAFATATYVSKKYSDTWMPTVPEIPGVYRQMTIDLEWRCFHLEVGGAIENLVTYGEALYRRLNLESYDLYLELLLSNWIIRNGNLQPSSENMEKMIQAYHLLLEYGN